MDLSPDKWKRVKELFEAALENWTAFSSDG